MDEALVRRAAAKSMSEEDFPATSQQRAFLQAVHQARDLRYVYLMEPFP